MARARLDFGVSAGSTLGSIGVLYLGSNNTQHTSTLPSSATYVRKKAPPHMVQDKHVSFDLVVVIVASEEALPHRST